jgi:hypothetical protein
MLNRLFVLIFIMVATLSEPAHAQAPDPLASWNNGAAKTAVGAAKEAKP